MIRNKSNITLSNALNEAKLYLSTSNIVNNNSYNMNLELAIFLRCSVIKKCYKILNIFVSILYSLITKKYKFNNCNILINSLHRKNYNNFLMNKNKGKYVFLTNNFVDYLKFKKNKYNVKFIGCNLNFIDLYKKILKNKIILFSLKNTYVFLLELYKDMINNSFIINNSNKIYTLCDTHYLESIIVDIARKYDVDTTSYQHGEVSSVWFPGNSNEYIFYDQLSLENALKLLGTKKLNIKSKVERYNFMNVNFCTLNKDFNVLVACSKTTNLINRGLENISIKLSDQGYSVCYKMRPNSSLKERMKLKLKFYNKNIHVSNESSIDHLMNKSSFLISAGSGSVIECGYYGTIGLNLNYLDKSAINVNIKNSKEMNSDNEVLNILKLLSEKDQIHKLKIESYLRYRNR